MGGTPSLRPCRPRRPGVGRGMAARTPRRGRRHGRPPQRARLDRQHAAGRLFANRENQTPAGSTKARIGLPLREAAGRDGKIGPGGTLIEATAGNTGLGLALVAAQKGYRLILVIPDKMSQEKVLHLKALGAEVRITRSDVGKGHPDYYQDMAERLAREMGAVYVNQCAHPAQPLAPDNR